MSIEEIKSIVEATLFANGKAMTVNQLIKILAEDDRVDSDRVIDITEKMKAEDDAAETASAEPETATESIGQGTEASADANADQADSVEDSEDEVNGLIKQKVREALAQLQVDYRDRPIELVEVGSGFRFQIRKNFSPWVAKLHEEKPPRYSRALLETLALIVYRQPITRAEIEEIRGVTVSTNIVKTLQEREWIRVVGHRDVPGKPAIYGTTKQFLDDLNIKSLDELPTLAELQDLDQLDLDLTPEQMAEKEKRIEALIEEDSREMSEEKLEAGATSGAEVQSEIDVEAEEKVDFEIADETIDDSETIGASVADSETVIHAVLAEDDKQDRITDTFAEVKSLIAAAFADEGLQNLASQPGDKTDALVNERGGEQDSESVNFLTEEYITDELNDSLIEASDIDFKEAAAEDQDEYELLDENTNDVEEIDLYEASFQHMSASEARNAFNEDEVDEGAYYDDEESETGYGSSAIISEREDDLSSYALLNSTPIEADEAYEKVQDDLQKTGFQEWEEESYADEADSETQH